MMMRDDASLPSSRFFVIAIHTILGPPLGAVMAAAIGILSMVFEAGSPLRNGEFTRVAEAAVKVVPGAFIISYVAGGMHALLTGIVIAAFASGGKYAYGAGAASAALVGLVIAAVTNLSGVNAWPYHLMLAAIGVATSLSLRLLFSRRFSPSSHAMR